MVNKISCPLCNAISDTFFEKNGRMFFKCTNCCSVFLDQSITIPKETEKQRYMLHNNNADHKGHLDFIEPLIQKVITKFDKGSIGLDFGSGEGAIITKALKERGYDIASYDPFFFDNVDLLKQKYNYIVCCEVIEHFSEPAKEFALLSSLLILRGALLCMTELYSEEIDFPSWYYKNDITHRFFYHRKAIEWIQREYGLASSSIDGRIIALVK